MRCSPARIAGAPARGDDRCAASSPRAGPGAAVPLLDFGFGAIGLLAWLRRRRRCSAASARRRESRLPVADRLDRTWRRHVAVLPALPARRRLRRRRQRVGRRPRLDATIGARRFGAELSADVVLGYSLPLTLTGGVAWPPRPRAVARRRDVLRARRPRLLTHGQTPTNTDSVVELPIRCRASRASCACRSNRSSSKPGLGADEILARMERISFQGRNLATARRIWEKMLAGDCTIFLGMAGALSAGGLRLVVAHLLDAPLRRLPRLDRREPVPRPARNARPPALHRLPARRRRRAAEGTHRSRVRHLRERGRSSARTTSGSPPSC